jgi:hypothetical protein
VYFLPLLIIHGSSFKNKDFRARVKNLTVDFLKYSVCLRLINALLSDSDKGRSSKKG